MFVDKSIIEAPTVVAAVLALYIGGLAFHSNPNRLINRYFLSLSVHVSFWLASLFLALTANPGLIWMRASCAIAGLIPLHLFLLREAAASNPGPPKCSARHLAGWLVVGLLMCILPTTYQFIPAHSTASHRIYGSAFYIYFLLQVASYAELCRGTIVKLRALKGIANIELQILLFGGCLTGAAILLLMLIGIATESRTYIRIQPIIIVSFYALTVASITTHKIFDASFLLQLACRRFILIVIVSGIGYISDQLVRLVISEPFAFAITTAAILGFAYRLDSFLGSLFSPSFLYTRIREAVHLRREGGQDFETQIFQYETILREWSQSTCAQLGVICEDNQFRQNGFQLGKAELEELQRIHWATPERLSRERTSDRRGSLAKFLTKSAIAALVHVEGKTLQITIALGVRDSGRPYVHHEIEFLIDTAVQIEESLARSYLALKTKRAERLAILGILGAGIAHEIRNPLVAMKALVQLLPSKYAESQFRELFFPLMSGEIERIERLTEQLLDLASPRKYDIKSFPISDLIESSLPLIRYQADKDSVEIRLTESSSKICIDVDSSSFRQVFINLCLNAIQAQAQQSRHRWVEIEYTIRLGGAELVIKDNGPGIRPEARERLFETFNTTKSTGFGLGLALSSNILSDQGARLSVDPYLEGKGAVFRVFFPCKVQLD